MSRALISYGSGSPADALEMSSTPWTSDGGMTVLEHKAVQSAGGGVLREIDEWIAAIKGDTMTSSGIAMSPETAMRVATVFACVRVIAEDVAKLPRQLLRREARDGRTRTMRADDDARYGLLTSTPNDWMTGQELMEYMVGQAALRGAAYARLVRQGGPGTPVTEILPLLPGTCVREQDSHDWSIAYRITGYGHGQEMVGPGDIWCMNGPMASPLAGADISMHAREAIALAQSLEGSQTKFHANDARPSGILTTKAAIKPETRDRIRESWQSSYGPGGRGGVAVLGDDFEFKTIAVTAADGQLIQNREFQILDICRFFRVMPWAVMVQASTQSYGTLEQTALAHIQNTIMPWVTRVEQTVQRDILDGESGIYLKLNMNALARGTLTDRFNAYKTGVGVHLTPNEIRILEDMDEIDDPNMDRVQLPANNTGLAPSLGAPSGADKHPARGAADTQGGQPKAPAKLLPPPYNPRLGA